MKSYSKQVAWQKASLWKNQGPLIWQLDVELTERCNFNCIHCYINKPSGDQAIKAREMSTWRIKAILDEVAELGAIGVRFTGGEPLLREDFDELYLYARRLGLKVRLFTNGSLITPERADLFARVPPLERIEITIYGMTPGSYAAATLVQGAYQQVQRGINLLLNFKVPFVVKGAVLPTNKGEIATFENWATTLPWMEGPPSYSLYLILRARRDSDKKNRQIEAIRQSPEESLAISTRRPEEFRKGMGEFCGKFLAGPPGERLLQCGAGQGGCLDAYGKLQPCMLLRHPETVYDLQNNNGSSSIKNALTDFFPRLRQWSATNIDYLYRCARCFLMGLCEQCPAKSWMEHGNLDTPVEYLCQAAHSQARYLELLEEGEHAWEVKDWQTRVARIDEQSRAVG